MNGPRFLRGRVLGGALLLAVVCPDARAGDPPALWEPAAAVTFLLDAPASRNPSPSSSSSSSSWHGSLGDGLVRGLFGTYRTVLSSQDLPLCGFSPSCSRFSQQAIARCGFFQGALLSMDRLIRDHPLAIGLYPMEGSEHLLRDEPDRYCLTLPTSSAE